MMNIKINIKSNNIIVKNNKKVKNTDYFIVTLPFIVNALSIVKTFGAIDPKTLPTTPQGGVNTP